MKFGTIGAGTVALAFAREALKTGHEVVLSSRRGPDYLSDKVAKLGRGAFAGKVEQAASLDYVLLAVPWRNVEAALHRLPAVGRRLNSHDVIDTLAEAGVYRQALAGWSGWGPGRSTSSQAALGRTATVNRSTASCAMSSSTARSSIRSGRRRC